MKQWIEVKVKFDKTQENGLIKKVSEPYLIDAISFTEAEERIMGEMSAYISGDFEVNAVRKSNLDEIFFNEDAAADRYYKAKLEFVTIDEKTMTEKRTKYFVLVQAVSLRDALNRTEDGMKGTVADYEIVSIAETQLMDVFRQETDGK